MSIRPELEEKVTVQDYRARPVIDGVRFIDLPRFVDDGGAFLELGRLAEGKLSGLADFVVRQLSYSTMQPGAIKAFHLHLVQNELWFVPPEHRLLVGLYDARDPSSTSGTSMRFVLGDGRARLLLIPHGVAHGASNLTGAITPIIYMMDQQFSAEPSSTDEHRLPWDLLGAAFWQMERG